MKNLFPTLLRASDAIDLREKVAQAITDGKDLYTPLFSDYSGELCQFVIPSICLYEYRLIEALDLEDLEAQARSLVTLDFDFMFNTVLWQGKYLQWMTRMNERGTSVKEMIVSTLLDDGTVDPGHRAQELHLVEDVREVLRLEPLRQRSVQAVDYALAIPFPLVGSINKA